MTTTLVTKAQLFICLAEETLWKGAEKNNVIVAAAAAATLVITAAPFASTRFD